MTDDLLPDVEVKKRQIRKGRPKGSVNKPKEPKKPIAWVTFTLADGTSYKVPAKRITNDQDIITDKDKLIAEVNRLGWEYLKKFAQIITYNPVDNNSNWEEVPKGVLY